MINEWNIHPEKLKKIWKSLTFWIAGVSAFVSAFIMNHPDYVDLLTQGVSQQYAGLIKDVVIDFVSMGGFAGIIYAKTRNSKPLEHR